MKNLEKKVHREFDWETPERREAATIIIGQIKRLLKSVLENDHLLFSVLLLDLRKQEERIVNKKTKQAFQTIINQLDTSTNQSSYLQRFIIAEEDRKKISFDKQPVMAKAA